MNTSVGVKYEDDSVGWSMLKRATSMRIERTATLNMISLSN